MPKQSFHLLVRSAFGGHEEGTLITDPAVVKDVLAGPNEIHVLRVPAEPAEQPDADGQAPRNTRAAGKG